MGLLGEWPVSTLRQQAANVVRQFLSSLSAPDLVPLDDDADWLVRQMVRQISCFFHQLAHFKILGGFTLAVLLVTAVRSSDKI